MRELVSASRVGRSLGVHLILATQKPSNSVSDEIWANSRFHLCLRVQTRSDSMEMLKRPDAAYIKGMGRCFIQIGNDELFEQVQTSYSGLTYQEMDENPLLLDDAGQVIRVKKKKKKTNQREYTQMNADHHKTQHIWRLSWQLTPSIISWDKKTGQKKVSFPFALADDVANQRYIVASADLLASRSLMIVGLAGTGKTTLIQTMTTALCTRYDPGHLHVYIMSLSSRTLGCLSTFPHVGEIVYEGEIHELHRLLNMLSDEVTARSKRFEAAWTNNFVEYNRSRQLKGEPVEPSIVVFVDRMAQVREMIGEDEETLNQLYDLIREGSSCGIFFVVTSMGGNEIPIKIRDCFRGIAMQLRERGDYSDTIGKRVPLKWQPSRRCRAAACTLWMKRLTRFRWRCPPTPRRTLSARRN